MNSLQENIERSKFNQCQTLAVLEDVQSSLEKEDRDDNADEL